MPVHETRRSDLSGGSAAAAGANANPAMVVANRGSGLRPPAVRRGLRSWAARSVAIAVPAAALVVPVAAMAAPAQHAGQAATQASQVRNGRAAALQPATTFTWHKLTLINGWKPAGTSTYHVAAPAYAISGGVVYLTGVMHQPTGTNDEFAVLPSAARPTRWLVRIVVTSGLASGSVWIGPDGTMRAISPWTPGSARAGTSLASVSYPAAGTTWHSLTLLNGWKTSQSTTYPSGNPAYAIKGGVVYLAGTLKQTTGTTTEFAVLPSAARPAHEMFLTVDTFTTGTVVIESNGDMLATASPQSDAQTITSLAGIAFPATGAAWHNLSLVNGWKSGNSSNLPTGNPAYAIINGVVYLSGSMGEPTGTSTLFAALPSAVRPIHNLYVPVATWSAGVGGVSIVPGLGMYVNGQPFTTAQSLTSLAGISYPLGS